MLVKQMYNEITSVNSPVSPSIILYRLPGNLVLRVRTKVYENLVVIHIDSV